MKFYLTPAGVANAEQKLKIAIKQGDDEDSVKLDLKVASGFSLDELLKILGQMIRSFWSTNSGA